MKKDARKSMGKQKRGAIIPAPPSKAELPSSYSSFFAQLKDRITQERLRTVIAANSAMIKLYWEIGCAILNKQNQEGWGAKVIDRLSADLKNEFPDMKGFSPRNLKYMRKFAESWPNFEIVQASLAQITWYHNIALLEKLETDKDRLWYAEKTLEGGWSRNVLAFQIESELHKRKGKVISNFALTLPPEESDMAKQVFKDPYLFDFLGTDDLRRESELEQKLIDHLQKFLIELGQGFAFVGRQVHLEVGDQDFYIDLLFYHLKLRCYVVIELKAGKFKPEHAAQVSMYLNLVDDLLRHQDDKPSIGLLLVRDKNNLIVEYALTGYNKPIGVAQWERELTRSIPAELKPSLPTIEEIETELAGDIATGDEE
jgi:predicted nuclease of restriction endonuclease-like (RecB) superfamily